MEIRKTATAARADIPAGVRSISLFGINVTPMAVGQIIDVLSWHVVHRQRCLMSSMNFHGLHVYRHDSAYRELNGQSLARIDGMPIVWIARVFGHKVEVAHRVAWLDLIGPVLENAAAQGWRIYWIAAQPHVLRAGLDEIRRRYPSLVCAGHHGYINEADSDALVDEVNRFAPDILLVGMGMGKQERWIIANANALQAPVIATTGACIEFLAGVVDTPPRWMGRYGLEWSYRLLKDPRRFWRRYLIEGWGVMFFILGRALSQYMEPHRS